MKRTRTAAFAMHSAFTLALGLAATSAFAGAGHDGHGRPAQEQSVGTPGDPKRISRVIEVGMTDLMRFDPAAITVQQGETIRFVVSNRGKVDHEMVLGTMEDLKSHGVSMRANQHVAHDDPSAARVEPGRKKALAWQFSKAGKIFYACLIPGHFEAGMVGKIDVLKG